MPFKSGDVEGEMPTNSVKQIYMGVVGWNVGVAELKPSKFARGNRIDGEYGETIDDLRRWTRTA
jgi:hypothetical protein